MTLVLLVGQASLLLGSWPRRSPSCYLITPDCHRAIPSCWRGIIQMLQIMGMSRISLNSRTMKPMSRPNYRRQMVGHALVSKSA